MRRTIRILILSLLLAGGVILCAVRWQAWFGMPAAPQWHGEMREYRFPSFETDTTPASLDILVMGDIHSHLTSSAYDTMAARLPQTDLVMQVGDWMERGQTYYYQLLLREWMESDLYGLPVIATPGNHEYSKGLCKTLSPVWDSAFVYPHNGPRNVPGVHYYIDLPHTRCIVIDTNPLSRLPYLTRLATWLRATIASAGGRYVVVMMHHPVLSVAEGRCNAMLYCAFRHVLGQADLVLAGHDHSYMRYTPFVILNTAGDTKPQRYHYTPDAVDTVAMYGHLCADSEGMIYRAYRLSDGGLIDSLYVSHH